MDNLQKVSDGTGRRRPGHDLRTELRTRYIAAGGYERASQKQLDWMERVIRYLSRVQRGSGNRILRSVPQMAKGLGLPVEGLTVRQIRDRYENQITNTLGYLELAGYVDHLERDLRHANGEGIGIVVVLPAGVAQSVRAAANSRTSVRNTRRPSCSFSGGRFAPPGGGTIGGHGLSTARTTRSEAAARESALGTRAGALWRQPVKDALDATVAAGVDEWTGARLLEALPWLADAPIEVVARELWRALGRPDGRLSPQALEALRRASSQLARTGYNGVRGPGASRAAVIDLALGDWADYWHLRRPGDKPPRTVGGLACCLRKLAHRLVTGARIRRRQGAGRG